MPLKRTIVYIYIALALDFCSPSMCRRDHRAARIEKLHRIHHGGSRLSMRIGLIHLCSQPISLLLWSRISLITSLQALSSAGRKGRSDQVEGFADSNSHGLPAHGVELEMVEGVEERDADAVVYEDEKVEGAQNESMEEKRPGSL